MSLADPQSVIRPKTCTSGAEADSDSAIRTKSINFDEKKANNGTFSSVTKIKLDSERNIIVILNDFSPIHR